MTEVTAEGEPVAERVRRALAERAFRIVYQPIVDLEDGRAVAVEALSRFTSEPYGPPDTWFADAWRVGLGAELELAAFEAALGGMDRIPTACRVAINLSPSVITHPDLLERVVAAGASRVVIELTEHVAVHDYDRVRSAVATLRGSGAKLAVDDMGAGFASFRHIVKLAPDIIKLDRELVHDIDVDPVRRSVAAAMVNFADDVGSDIVAEGIETPGELEAVRALRIRYGQGMLIGAPELAESLACTLRLGTRPWARGSSDPARTERLLVAPCAPSHDRAATAAAFRGTAAALRGTADALVRLAEAAVRGELGAEPGEVAALDQAVSAIAAIAARRGAAEREPMPGAPCA